MIIVSDNTATAMLVQSIGGPADVNATMRDLAFGLDVAPIGRTPYRSTTEVAWRAGEAGSTSVERRDVAQAAVRAVRSGGDSLATGTSGPSMDLSKDSSNAAKFAVVSVARGS